MSEQQADMKLASKGRWHAILILISIITSLIPLAFASADLNSSLINRSIAFNISPDGAYAIMQNKPGSVVIDVRTPKEYMSGHLEGAINLDYYSNGFLDGLKSLDKNSTYIIYCRRGIRGARALEMMRALGFKEVYNILGGLTLWAQEGWPMIGEVI